jgi:hypothetical protein
VMNESDSSGIHTREMVPIFQGKCSGTTIKSQARTKDGCLRYGTPYGGHELPGRQDLFRPGDIMYGFG